MRTTSLILASTLFLLTSCAQEASADSFSPESEVGSSASGLASDAQNPGKKKKFVPPPAKKIPTKGKPAPKPNAGQPETGKPETGKQVGANQEMARKAAEANKLEAQLKAQGATQDQIQKKLNALTGGKPVITTQVDPNAKLVLEFGREKHDFGRSRQGDILEHNFEMQAGGTAPLKIRQASPTCGCTVGEVRVENEAGEMVVYEMGDPIEPGRRILINAKLNTITKRNRTQVQLKVYHNDPAGVANLGLTADIEPFIAATPAFLNFGDIKMGETKTQTVDIRTSRGEPVMLTEDNSRVKSKQDGFEIEVLPLNPDADGRSAHWQAKVTIKEGVKEGPLGYQLSMLTDVEMPVDHSKHGHADGKHADEPGATPQMHRVTASINARVLGALSATPTFLSFGLLRPGQVVPRIVKVISHDDSIDLSKMKASIRGSRGAEFAYAEYFSTSVKPSTKGTGYDVELRLNGLPEGESGTLSFKGELVIETGVEQKPEIVVNFSGVSRPGVR